VNFYIPIIWQISLQQQLKIFVFRKKIFFTD
jgi:hypothetical protein